MMFSLSRFPKGSFERLEPYEGKLSCTVLRGGSGSNAGVLPDQPQQIPAAMEKLKDQWCQFVPPGG